MTFLGLGRDFKAGSKEFVVKRSTRKGKQAMAVFNDGDVVHFGDPDMKEYPGSDRGDNYCSRSYGIKNKKGKPTRNNPKSPNFLSREVLWNCDGKKSKKGKPPKRLI